MKSIFIFFLGFTLSLGLTVSAQIFDNDISIIPDVIEETDLSKSSSSTITTIEPQKEVLVSDVELVDKQLDYYYNTGEYYTETSYKDKKVHTYTELCTGFYIIDTTDPTVVTYKGFGDLKDEFTYEQEIPISITSTSTNL